MRPPTYFDGPARAVAHEMWCTTAYDFFGCALVIIREKQLRSYDAFLANRLGCTIAYDVSVQMSDQSLGTVVGVQMTLLAVFMSSAKRFVFMVTCNEYLPSRRRRQHDVLAPVRPGDGTAGAIS